MYNRALPSRMRARLIEKDSRSARRADRSRQRQARLHTVGFVWPGAKGPTASLCANLAEGQLACAVPKPGRRIYGGVV